jgi:uncharacterized protein (UPF0333 family)
MKQTLITLLVVLFLAGIVGLAAAKTTKKSAADTVISRVTGDYEKAVRNATASYDKSTARLLKKYSAARDKKIISAGNNAIKRLTSTRKEVSGPNGARMEQEIEKVRKSIDDQVGNAPEVTPKAKPKAAPRMSVIAACSATLNGHTYLAIDSKVHHKTANAMCKKMGGHLVYIETAEELVFLLKTFCGRAWVGATDAHKEGDWRWGNRKPIARDIWFKGQPDNQNNEDYAILDHRNGVRLLNDVSADNQTRLGFICEWE